MKLAGKTFRNGLIDLGAVWSANFGQKMNDKIY